MEEKTLLRTLLRHLLQSPKKSSKLLWLSSFFHFHDTILFTSTDTRTDTERTSMAEDQAHLVDSLYADYLERSMSYKDVKTAVRKYNLDHPDDLIKDLRRSKTDLIADLARKPCDVDSDSEDTVVDLNTSVKSRSDRGVRLCDAKLGDDDNNSMYDASSQSSSVQMQVLSENNRVKETDLIERFQDLNMETAEDIDDARARENFYMSHRIANGDAGSSGKCKEVSRLPPSEQPKEESNEQEGSSSEQPKEEEWTAKDEEDLKYLEEANRGWLNVDTDILWDLQAKKLRCSSV